MTYFGEFCYLNSSWIRKSITLMFMSSSRKKITLLCQNSVADVRGGGNEVLSLSFPTPCSRVSFRVPLARDFSHYPSISLKKRSSTRRVEVNLRRNCRVLFTTRQTRKHLIPAMLTVSNWIQSLPKRLIKSQEAH